MSTESVLFKTNNQSRLITLNRVNKLNSLNLDMVEKILPRLIESSKTEGNIILTSNSPKALCAGGDVAECARAILDKKPELCAQYFQQEYNLDYLISTLPRPYVSIMDNITMGGGVGLSVHAPFRIATERTKLAMPEMDIGFFPDVGTTFFLPKLDDKVGYYYALTGQVLTGFDVYYAGFATHYIKSERLDSVMKRLEGVTSFQGVNEILKEFEENKTDYKPKFSTQDIQIIKTAFAKKTIEEVFEYLTQDNSEFSQNLLKTMSAKPISSLKVAFALLKKGETNSIRQQFELEMIAATNIVNLPAENNDFCKGVKHKLLDKIKEPFFPQWSEIEPNYVEKILTKSMNTTKQLASPLLNKYFGVDYKNYPYNFGLPKTQDVAEYITGNDGLGRAYLPTPNEVVQHFKKSGKLGVEEKVKQILAIHGETKKYDGKYVGWKN